MADRRVHRTKRNIRKALEDALREKPFEQITVTELCERADISRITFYSHYEDKFALMNEIYADLLGWATVQYRNRQRANNPEEDIIKTFQNLMDSIFDLYEAAESIVSAATIERNPYLHYSFYEYIANNMEIIFEHRADRLRMRYPSKQVIGFICAGIWGFIKEYGELDLKTIRRDTKQVLSDILRANIVTEMIEQ